MLYWAQFMVWRTTANKFGGKMGRRYLRLLLISQGVMLCAVLTGCGAAATPVPVPEKSSEVSFKTEDDVQIKGRLFGEGQTGVVLAHMYPADQTSWWEFAQVLADQGYVALAFDFRGYGDSGGRKEIIRIDRDVEAAIEFLQDQGASTIFLIGASMGGTASLKVAASQSVAGVVSLSAPVKFLGVSVEAERIRVPVLLMASEGDRSAKNSVQDLIVNRIIGGSQLVERVVYAEGNDHGTDILKGENAVAATQAILGFLKQRQP